MQLTRQTRRGVTLIELIIAMGILVVLAAISMSAMSNLNEQSRIARTKTIIRKIDAVLSEKWEAYRTRPLPLPTMRGVGTADLAVIRLRALRDLMRMELPERATDIDPLIGPNATNPVGPVNLTASPMPSGGSYGTVSLAPPAAFKRYQRIINALPAAKRAIWADTYAQSECLYLILSGIRDGESTALDFLAPSEVGDLDGDGLKEVLDGWGQPIWFLRWAPGFVKEANALTLQSSQPGVVPDPFDTFQVDTSAYALRPLIFSAGPDKLMDIYLEYNKQNDKLKDIRYADPLAGNGYYPVKIFVNTTTPEGMPFDMNGDGASNWIDNITNHYLETP